MEAFEPARGIADAKRRLRVTARMRDWAAGARWLLAAGALLVLCAVWIPAAAQAPGGWEVDSGDPQSPANTTVVPRSTGVAKPSGGRGQIFLSAYLTDTSPAITQGLVWRVFRDGSGSEGKIQLVSTHREASPTLRLDAGNYRINVALGRANLTRKIAVAGDQLTRERFVLNAGGLRVLPVLSSGEPASEKQVSIDVESDERDDHGERTKIITGAKPGLVLRLNAGIYSIVSTYGDANAVARADVTVEAGKLSEVTLLHAAARVSFKLVTRGGGDAIADTQWSVTNRQGDPIKQSSGALPTHLLSPGDYAVRANHAGRFYKRDFSVKAGDSTVVEVVMP
jgi:hypothetical protein